MAVKINGKLFGELMSENGYELYRSNETGEYSYYTFLHNEKDIFVKYDIVPEGIGNAYVRINGWNNELAKFPLPQNMAVARDILSVILQEVYERYGR